MLKEKTKVINNQRKVTSSKQKLILNLQKKLKGNVSWPVRKNVKNKNIAASSKAKPAVRGKVLRQQKGLYRKQGGEMVKKIGSF